MRDLTGCWSLVRFILRRDRVRLPVWLVSISGLVYLQAEGVRGVYRSPEELARAGRLIANNAAFVAMSGPPRALDTLGGRTAFEICLFAMLMAAMMNLFLVTRHTRAEEETGRAELVRSAVIGRHAPVVAVLLVAVAADALLAVLVALPLIALDLPVAGSWAMATGIAVAGLVFGGVAAVAAQLSASTRAASGMAGAALAVAFVVRAVGDIGSGTVSWLSPLGWGQAIRPFATERWWPALLGVAAAVGLAAMAFALTNRRDHGAGLWPPRPGPASASELLATPVGLAARLQRATVVAWTAGVFLGGVAYGSIGGDVEDLVADNEVMREVTAQLGGNLLDSFLATTSLVMALIAAGFAIQGTLRLHGEERAGRAEPVLALAVSRWAWLRSHLLVVVVGSVAVLVATGLGTGVTYAIVAGSPSDVLRLLAASLVYLPATLVAIGVAVALFGLAPRATGLAWAMLGLWLVIGMFGQVLRIPAWVQRLSPYQHVPKLPAASFELLPMVLLTLVAAALVTAGAAGFRARDLST